MPYLASPRRNPQNDLRASELDVQQRRELLPAVHVALEHTPLRSVPRIGILDHRQVWNLDPLHRLRTQTKSGGHTLRR